MKRFISVMAVVVMLLTLAVPAFAEGSPVLEPDAPKPNVESAEVDGKSVELVVTEGEIPGGTNVNSALEAAKEAVGGSAAGDADTAEVFDFEVKGDADAENITVVVTRKDGKIVGAACWDESGKKWDGVKVKDLGDGRFELTFPHFCTVVLFVDSDVHYSAAPAKKQQSSGKKSPQTGYDNTVYAVVMTGLLLCAGFCFVRAGKKETN